MAAALTTPATAKVGDSIVITGTGWANNHAYTATVSRRGQDDIVFTSTTSTTNIDSTGKLSIVLNEPGQVHISVNDGTSTVVAQIEVWSTN